MALTNTQVKGALALGVVGISMAVIAVLSLVPVFVDVDHAKWADTVGKLVSPLTGLVGVIVGYYFGRQEK